MTDDAPPASDRAPRGTTDADERPARERPSAGRRAAAPPSGPPARRKRTSPRQFLREVRGELKRVAWPSRREVVSYSVIVLVVVTLIGAFIFGLDTLFGRFIFTIFQ